MEFNIKEAIKSHELCNNCHYSVHDDDIEWIEEQIRRHLERIELDWKSPLTIPKRAGDRNLSVVVLVRIAGVDGLSFGRYNFEKECWSDETDMEVTGWNYMTKGMFRLLQKFNQIIRTYKNPENYYFEMLKFCKHVGFSNFEVICPK